MTKRAHKNLILDVKDLVVDIAGNEVLHGVSLQVASGEIVGIVGQSGSGKSTLLRAIVGLLPAGARVLSGSIVFDNRDITQLTEAQTRNLRGSQISYLFQNGLLSLDPLFAINKQFDEVLAAHDAHLSSSEKEDLLLQMGVDEPARVLASLPSELSGGLCQRCVLAFAIATNPCLLLADEPTSALDVQSAKQVGELLLRLSTQRNMAVLIAAHDINFVSRLASKIIVMHEGHFVECGNTQDILHNPKMPYTKELIAAIPKSSKEFVSIRGAKGSSSSVSDSNSGGSSDSNSKQRQWQ